MTLNTRPNGQVKPCSQVMDMPPIKKNSTVENILEAPADYWNLTEDTVSEIWNSDFMRDFRMRKIRGEYIPFCETCYQEDAIGIKSKRQAVIDKYYNDNKHLVDEAAQNNGKMNTMPVWWEMRLSSICNQACRMCIPQTSSKMRNEFSEFVDELPITVQNNTNAAIRQYTKHGYLGDSQFFLDQFWEGIADIRYLELHGGEPTNDPVLWDLIERIVYSGHNEHIHIHVHTNIHSLKKRHVELWDKFASGWIGVSIDAYKEENEYIRYGSSWAKIEENLKLLGKLGPHWTKWVTSSVMVYNACTMHKLVSWFESYVSQHKLNDLWWRLDPVTSPNMMRLEHIPLGMREQAVRELEELKIECMQTKQSVSMLIKALQSSHIPPAGAFDELVAYTRILDHKRQQDVCKVFPHLRMIFKQEQL